MSYEFNKQDAFDFFSTINIDTRVKGEELETKVCPYCRGGAHGDQWTFALNLEKAVYNCFRAECGASGRFEELCRDFGYELDWGKPKIYRNLPQPTRNFSSSERVLEYLKNRGIGENIAKKYQITSRIKDPNVMVFPFFDEQGKLQFIKYRNMDYKKGDKGSKEWCEKDTMPILFGMHQCEDRSTLIITEGQIDSLSVAQAGYKNCVSVPTGAMGFTWIVPCLDWLNSFEQIIVFGDWERGKMSLLDTIKSRVEPTVKAVRRQDYLGEKDANDILCKYGVRAVQKCIENAQIPRIESVKALASVQNIDINKIDKIPTGIDELDRVIGGLCMGQVVLLTGKRGDGKSTFMSQLICSALENGRSVFAYSGELADFHFKRWIDYQLAGKSYLTEGHNAFGDVVYSIPEDIEEKISKWYSQRAYIYDNQYLPEDKGEYESLLETIKRVIKTYNTELICIDNLMTALDTVEHQNDLYLAQSNFVGQLKKIAMEFNVCVILVAHPRKATPGFDSFDNDNVSGSSDVTNKVDIVLNYSRVKKKESDEYTDEVGISHDVKPDSMLEISKNRLFGVLKMGKDNGIALRYSNATKRIGSIYDCKVMHYGWEDELEPVQFKELDIVEDEEDFPFMEEGEE